MIARIRERIHAHAESFCGRIQDSFDLLVESFEAPRACGLRGADHDVHRLLRRKRPRGSIFRPLQQLATEWLRSLEVLAVQIHLLHERWYSSQAKWRQVPRAFGARRQVELDPDWCVSLRGGVAPERCVGPLV